MKCVNCGNNSFYECEDVRSTGGYGPDLLPGTGVFKHAKFSLKICSSCGFIHWFVNDDDIERIKSSSKFTYNEYKEE